MTSADLSRAARRLYAAGPFVGRTIQSLRPYSRPRRPADRQGHRPEAAVADGMNQLHDLVMARQWVRYVEAETVRQWVETCGLRTGPMRRINTLWHGYDLLVAERPS